MAWNPSDSSASLIFSNNNLSVESPLPNIGFRGTREELSRNSGIYYFEIRVDENPAGIQLGFANISAPHSDSGYFLSEDGNSLGWATSSFYYYNYAMGYWDYEYIGTTFYGGSHVGMGVNLDTNEYSLYLNGTLKHSQIVALPKPVYPFALLASDGGIPAKITWIEVPLYLPEGFDSWEEVPIFTTLTPTTPVPYNPECGGKRANSPFTKHCTTVAPITEPPKISPRPVNDPFTTAPRERLFARGRTYCDFKGQLIVGHLRED